MAVTFSALARLLTYPSAELQTLAPDIARLIREEKLVSETVCRALDRLAADLAGADLYEAQERFTDLFDRTRSLSLNLYEHVHGESRDRGQAMVALLELYRTHGLELSANELPDPLPVFLEFLSVLPRDEAASLLGEATHVLEAMAERLKKRGSPYRAVFGALAQLADQPADPAALAALLAEPEENPADLEALDKLWEETAVTFGPSDVGCPKAEEMVAAMQSAPPARLARTPAPEARS